MQVYRGDQARREREEETAREELELGRSTVLRLRRLRRLALEDALLVASSDDRALAEGASYFTTGSGRVVLQLSTTQSQLSSLPLPQISSA